MGRMYTVVMGGVTVLTAQDLFALIAPATKAGIIHEIRLGQNSDFGDAQAEGIGLRLGRYTGADGSGGSVQIPSKLSSGDPASSFTARRNDTTVAGGMSTFLFDVFNIQAGYLYLPTPETRPQLAPSEKFVIRMTAPPNDALFMYGTLTFEEIG